jgi:uncharacterized protein (DUF2062 family)
MISSSLWRGGGQFCKGFAIECHPLPSELSVRPMKKSYLKLVRSSLRTIRHPHLRDRAWWRTLSRPVADRRLWIPCRDTVAAGLAIGMFFSLMPMPFQSIAATLLAMRFRANVPFAFAACWISNPITTPAILFGQCFLGNWLRDSLSVPMPHFLAQVQFHVPKVGMFNAASFLLGTMVSGVIVALLSYPLVHAFSALLPQHLPVRRMRKNKAENANAA